MSLESSDKATIQAYESATFVVELEKTDSTLALDDLRIILATPGTICYCELRHVTGPFLVPTGTVVVGEVAHRCRL